jgi:hypothetical protein
LCDNNEDKEIPMRTISTSIMAVIFAVCFVLAASSHFAEGAEMMMEKGEMKVKNWAAGAEMMEKEGEMMVEKGGMKVKEGEMEMEKGDVMMEKGKMMEKEGEMMK